MSDSTVPGRQTDSTGERIKETERERIARDLHDELGSRLTAIKMAVAQLGQQGQDAADAASRDASAQEQRQFADQLIDDAIGAMHDIIDDLRPAVLDLGLAAALEWLARTYSRQTGVPYRMLTDNDLPETLLDSFQLISLYRIAREALHNASRHAQARKVDISLTHTPGLVAMEITDDGVGLDNAAHASTQAESSGIRGMQHRAAAIGASLTLLPGEQGGLKLRVTLPVLSAANLIK
ncbi:sensor histidine kinase [Herbaspirillum rhizosphaerae]|uniref:sensor histidine kinase n=1 Tax=Herbaspirillum rhizosphaerae TaxID=346179 RepID=UPI00067B712D|nr:sensor histidine kinase [Herbaspirillum rhizosphaerae]